MSPSSGRQGHPARSLEHSLSRISIYSNVQLSLRFDPRVDSLPRHSTNTATQRGNEMVETPIGSELAFAGPITSIPANYLLCAGQSVSRTTYPLLFDAIGTGWGGDGVTTFNLPDLSGRFLRGVDIDRDGHPTNPPRDPDRDLRLPPLGHPGPSSGNSGNEVGSLQGEDFKAHVHGGMTDISGAPNNPNKYDPVGGFSFDISGTGSAGGHETRPTNSYVLWIIRAS